MLSSCSQQKATEAYTKEPLWYAHSALQEIPFYEVHIQDDFWSDRIKTVADSTLPLVWELARAQGRMENFKIVAGQSEATYHMRNSPDAPVYKLIEAAAYTFTQAKNKPLEAAIDSLIALAGQAQQADGYLHTQFMLPKGDPSTPTGQAKAMETFGFGKEYQWKSKYTSWPKGYSQLFTAGHMFEAAVAYYRATGKHALLDISIKFADLLVKVFQDETFVKQYADHPEVGIGLMKLYEVTRNEAYLALADKLTRHIKFVRPVDLHQEEAMLPLQEQTNAYGHAVRTAYIYTGATDVVRATGAKDLGNALDHLWHSVAGKKMYLHGGTGNGTEAEQHGTDYDLPIYATYSECCANIAQGQWNHSLNLLTGNAQYADIVELEMYNAALSGISLDGKAFFYSNKINVGLEDRKGKFGGVRETYFFCCPSKLPSFVSGVSRWMYAKNREGIFINQYIGSTVQTLFNDQPFNFSLETGYPYEGKTTLHIQSDVQEAFSVSFRIPYWLRGDAPFQDGLYYFDAQQQPSFSIKVNGKEVEQPEIVKGYISINRKWQKGDTITLTFDMPVRRVYTRKQDKYNAGRVALMRGPVLYCLEGVDNSFDIAKFVLPKSSDIKAASDTALFGGTYVLKGKGLVKGKTVAFKAIPYALWQNRGISKMSLLLIENPQMIYPEKEELKDAYNTNG